MKRRWNMALDPSSLFSFPFSNIAALCQFSKWVALKLFAIYVSFRAHSIFGCPKKDLKSSWLFPNKHQSLRSLGFKSAKKKFQLENIVWKSLKSLNSINIDFNAEYKIGRTPFVKACINWHKEVVKLLLDHYGSKNIDFNAKGIHGRTPVTLHSQWDIYRDF